MVKIRVAPTPSWQSGGRAPPSGLRTSRPGPSPPAFAVSHMIAQPLPEKPHEMQTSTSDPGQRRRDLRRRWGPGLQRLRSTIGAIGKLPRRRTMTLCPEILPGTGRRLRPRQPRSACSPPSPGEAPRQSLAARAGGHRQRWSRREPPSPPVQADDGLGTGRARARHPARPATPAPWTCPTTPSTSSPCSKWLSTSPKRRRRSPRRCGSPAATSSSPSPPNRTTTRSTSTCSTARRLTELLTAAGAGSVNLAYVLNHIIAVARVGER